MMVDSNHPDQSSSTSGGRDDASGDVVALLDQYCTNHELRNLIRTFRPAEAGFQVSGRRAALISIIRKLYSLGHVKLSTLEEILERAEENGRQHIYLYTAIDKDFENSLSDFERLERNLLGGRTRSDAGLPRFQARPMDSVLSDLRLDRSSQSDYWHWTYKVYNGSERWRLVGEPEVKGDEKLVRYRREYRRQVLLMRWHSYRVLELRIPTGNSLQELERLRTGLMQIIAVVLSRVQRGEAENFDSAESLERSLSTSGALATPLDFSAVAALEQFKPFDIPVSSFDKAARDKSVTWLGVNETDYKVDGNRVTAATEDRREDLYQNTIVATALENVTDCTRLNTVVHIPDGNGSLDELTVEFCPTLPNEIRIGGETTPEVIDFILRRSIELATGDLFPPDPRVDQAVSSSRSRPLLPVERLADVMDLYPYLANAMIRLGKWVEDHPTVEFLDPRRLQQQLGTGLHRNELAVAVSKLVEAGLLENKYRVKPQYARRPLPTLFDSLEQILTSPIVGEDGEVVDLATSEVIPVYGKAGPP